MPVVVRWITDHWKLVTGVFAFVASIGGALMWFPRWRKARADATMAVFNQEQLKRELQDRSTAQAVAAYANARRTKTGNQLLSFSEEELRDALPSHHALRLHAAMEMLRKDGRAKKAATGDWLID